MLRTAQLLSCTGGKFFRGEKNGERVRSDVVKIAPACGVSKSSTGSVGEIPMTDVQSTDFSRVLSEKNPN
jgi:hypothetical protein